MIYAKLTTNQMGIAVDVRKDEDEWQMLDLYPFKSYDAPTVCQYSSCINPARQTQEIAEYLRGKGCTIVSVR